jgi:hypothetical protein
MMEFEKIKVIRVVNDWMEFEKKINEELGKGYNRSLEFVSSYLEYPNDALIMMGIIKINSQRHININSGKLTIQNQKDI